MSWRESLISDYLKVEPRPFPMLELLGELYQERRSATAAQHFGRAVEILLENPEPGMPTLPAELFEKVQALAPAAHCAKTCTGVRPQCRIDPGTEPIASVVAGSNRSRRSQNRRPWSWPKSRWWRVRSDWWMPSAAPVEVASAHPRPPCRRTSRPAACRTSR